jgi:hypothetical protein
MHEVLVQILFNTEGQSGVISNMLNIDFLLIFRVLGQSFFLLFVCEHLTLLLLENYLNSFSLHSCKGLNK